MTTASRVATAENSRGPSATVDQAGPHSRNEAGARRLVDPGEIEWLSEIEDVYWWHRARRTIICRVLRRYARPDSLILDLGCGPGGTTHSFSDIGRVLGADVAREAAVLTGARGVETMQMDATRIAAQPDRFDVVTALDMLEHLDDDARAVREIARVLKPGGYLVACVPAYEFLWSEHDDAVGHRRRYVREGLERVLKGAGFHVERCAYTMTAVLPAAVGMRLAQATAPAAPHAAPKRPRQRSQTRELPAGARRWTRGRAVRPGASPLWAEHPCRGSPPAGPTGTRGG